MEIAWQGDLEVMDGITGEGGYHVTPQKKLILKIRCQIMIYLCL